MTLFAAALLAAFVLFGAFLAICGWLLTKRRTHGGVVPTTELRTPELAVAVGQ